VGLVHAADFITINRSAQKGAPPKYPFGGAYTSVEVVRCFRLGHRSTSAVLMFIPAVLPLDDLSMMRAIEERAGLEPTLQGPGTEHRCGPNRKELGVRI
jgi:hypothetical protein